MALWHRSRLSLILCALGFHAWHHSRAERWGGPTNTLYSRCSRCHALRTRA